jgi:hypothetical protein
MLTRRGIKGKPIAKDFIAKAKAKSFTPEASNES